MLFNNVPGEQWFADKFIGGKDNNQDTQAGQNHHDSLRDFVPLDSEAAQETCEREQAETEVETNQRISKKTGTFEEFMNGRATFVLQ